MIKGRLVPFVTKIYKLQTQMRASHFLTRELSFSQKQMQSFIARSRLFHKGEAVQKPSQLIDGEVEFVTFEPISMGLEPIFEDDEFVVYDKPSGVLVHPQNRHTPYSLIDELRSAYGDEANITHRLDQETSGLVLCAKNRKSEIAIKQMFEHREIEKRYLALVHGELKEPLSIDAPLLRYDDERSALVRMVVKVDSSGKNSLTHIKPLKMLGDKTLVECSPVTGRQHQIRVHLFHVKHTIVGEPVYGQDESDLVRYLERELSRDERVDLSGARRLLLHANELKFELNGKSYHIKSPLDFEAEALKNML